MKLIEIIKIKGMVIVSVFVEEIDINGEAFRLTN